MTTTPEPFDLDELLDEYASAHVEYWTSEDGSPFEADAKKRRESAAEAIREQFAQIEDERDQLKAKLADPTVKAVVDLVEQCDRQYRRAEAAHDAKDEANRRWLAASTNATQP